MNFSFGKVRSIQVLVVGGLIVAAVFGVSRPAFADPHAMFYTVSGQQQLFFNMLAALDQADYVESATQAPGSPKTISREGLLDNRGQAGFGKTNNTILNATETSLNNILTRNITLEGQDLWTTYIGFQIALEAQRRKDTAALLEYYCQRVLGIKNCQQNAEGPLTAEARKATATEIRPLDPWIRAVADGVGVLFSGTPSDKAERQRRLNPKNPDPNKAKAFNPYIALINKSIAGNSEKQLLWDSIVSPIASFGAAKLNPQVFDNLVFEDGVVTLSDDATLDDYARTLASLGSLSTSLLEARFGAEQQRLAEAQQLTVDGVKADTYAIPYTLEGEIGEIGTGVKVAAIVKAGQAQGLSNGLTDLVGNPNYVGTRQSPGQTRLINSQSGKAAGISSDGTVLGTSSDAKTGRVAGDSDEESGEIKNEVSGPINDAEEDPSLDIGRSIDEDFFTRLLQEEAGVNQPGIGVTTEDVIKQYGNQIINEGGS
jgi:hypothetical protein